MDTHPLEYYITIGIEGLLITNLVPKQGVVHWKYRWKTVNIRHFSIGCSTCPDFEAGINWISNRCVAEVLGYVGVSWAGQDMFGRYFSKVLYVQVIILSRGQASSSCSWGKGVVNSGSIGIEWGMGSLIWNKKYILKNCPGSSISLIFRPIPCLCDDT